MGCWLGLKFVRTAGEVSRLLGEVSALNGRQAALDLFRRFEVFNADLGAARFFGFGLVCVHGLSGVEVGNFMGELGPIKRIPTASVCPGLRVDRP